MLECSNQCPCTPRPIATPMPAILFEDPLIVPDGIEPAELTHDSWQFSKTLPRAFRFTRPVFEPAWVEFELQVQ